MSEIVNHDIEEKYQKSLQSQYMKALATLHDNVYIQFTRFTIFDSKALCPYTRDYGMKGTAFVEMIYDLISTGVAFNVDEIKIHFLKSNTAFSDHGKILNKYGVVDSDNLLNHSHKPQNLLQVGIIDEQQYKYLQDEYARSDIRKKIKDVKTAIKTFAATQTSYDNISRFTQLLDV